jgi:hypothetical protein
MRKTSLALNTSDFWRRSNMAREKMQHAAAGVESNVDRRGAEPTPYHTTRTALVSDSRCRLSSADRPGSGSPKNAAVRLC